MKMNDWTLDMNECESGLINFYISATIELQFAISNMDDDSTAYVLDIL